MNYREMFCEALARHVERYVHEASGIKYQPKYVLNRHRYRVMYRLDVAQQNAFSSRLHYRHFEHRTQFSSKVMVAHVAEAHHLTACLWFVVVPLDVATVTVPVPF
jgi:hypothetical protein